MGSLSQLEIKGQEFIDYRVGGVGGVMVHVPSGETFFYDASGNVGIGQNTKRRIIRDINEISDEIEAILTTQEDRRGDLPGLIALQNEGSENMCQESVAVQVLNARGRNGQRVPGEFGYHKADVPLRVRGGRNEERIQKYLIEQWRSKIGSCSLV